MKVTMIVKDYFYYETLNFIKHYSCKKAILSKKIYFIQDNELEKNDDKLVKSSLKERIGVFSKGP